MTNKEVKKYFVYDYLGDDFMFFDTEAEAEKALKDLAYAYLSEGEDADDIDCILMGNVRRFGNGNNLA